MFGKSSRATAALWAGITAGAVVGGCLALLFAPQPADRTRAAALRQARIARDRARRLGDSSVALLRDALRDGDCASPRGEHGSRTAPE